MEEFLARLNKAYDNRFSYLKLFDIVYDKRAFECTFCFLYPENMEEVNKEDRAIILDKLKEFFALNADIKVKFRKSYLDSSLIKKETVQFFDKFQKALMPYIDPKNITSSVTAPLKVDLEIKINADVLEMIDELKIKQDLKAYLEDHFIMDVQVKLVKNDEFLASVIDVDDIPVAMGRKTERYSVNIIGKILSGDIAPMPEYISNIKSPKLSVILAGTVSNKQKRTFTQKKGKHQGEEKSYYTFTLTDARGSIECVYFCSKTHERQLEALEDGMFILCNGNVQMGLSEKLTYYIKKMCYASPNITVEDAISGEGVKLHRKHVVTPQPITTETQSNLFETDVNYTPLITENDIVVFDLETTDLDTETCEIVEIGAIKVCGGVIKEYFSSFIRPTAPMDERVIAIHHITNEMVADAPSAEDVLLDFYDFAKGCVLCGHNIVGFDLKIIKRIGKEFGINFDNEYVDTLNMSRRAGLKVANFKLGTLAKAFDIDLSNAHRAYHDALATAKLLLKLSKTA